jgi:hypothetical protein
MAGELLQGLETRDLSVIEKRLRPLSRALAAHGRAPLAVQDEGGYLGWEQLDLLDGIAKSVEASVDAIRRSSEPHLRCIETAESLLRYLVDVRKSSRRGRLPVC